MSPESIKQSFKSLASVGAVAVLLAVPALGFARLGSGLFPASGGAGIAEDQAAAASILTFDAPASTVMRLKAAERADHGLTAPADAGQETDTVLTDWEFTARRSRPNPFFVSLFIAFEHAFLHHHHHHHHHPSPCF
jgi:hypothetical protein